MSFPGQISKLSERIVASAPTMEANADVLIVSGTAAIANLIPKTPGVGNQAVTLIPLAAATLVATGNIAVAVALVVNRAQTLVYSRSQNKWYPAIAAV
jgi:hypothetical protein